MDELSAFRFAPTELLELERELLEAADMVFTGGYSLY
jgi:UDP-galactopyranose mutase